MLRIIIQTKRRYKKVLKHKVKTSEEIDNNDSSCTGDESEDGQSSISHNDQDSDEEIDTTEIEKEDWVDNLKRSTNEAVEKMGNEKIRRWNKTHKKLNGDWR